MWDIIIIIIYYTVHFLQIPALYCQLSRIPSLWSRLIPPVPRLCCEFLFFPGFALLGGCLQVSKLCWLKSQPSRGPSIPMLPLPSSPHSGEAGDALGRAALSWCEDDVLCEMVEVTLLMREINCSNQSRNLREEMTEAYEYMVLTKALPEISLSWKIELWLLQRVRMIASVTMLQELYKEQPKQFRH